MILTLCFNLTILHLFVSAQVGHLNSLMFNTNQKIFSCQCLQGNITTNGFHGLMKVAGVDDGKV